MCETKLIPNEINNTIFNNKIQTSHQKSNDGNWWLRFFPFCLRSIFRWLRFLIMHLVSCVTRNNVYKVRTYKLQHDNNRDGEQNINLWYSFDSCSYSF